MKYRIIVSAIIEYEDKILLGRKPENVGPYPNTWIIPGGGVNLEEETCDQALRRELQEETKIEIADSKFIFFDEDYEPNKHGDMTHYIFLTYLVHPKNKLFLAGDDVSHLEWVERNKLRKLTLSRPSIKLFKSLGWT